MEKEANQFMGLIITKYETFLIDQDCCTFNDDNRLCISLQAGFSKES